MTEVSIGAVPGGSADLRGYLARPSGDGPWPGVVAVHELFGLDDQFRRHCDRLAAAGYLTLGVNLFSDGGPRRCIVTTMGALFRGKGKPVADIDAARQYLTESADTTGKVGSSASAWVVASRCCAHRAVSTSPRPTTGRHRPVRPTTSGTRVRWWRATAVGIR